MENIIMVVVFAGIPLAAWPFMLTAAKPNKDILLNIRLPYDKLHDPAIPPIVQRYRKDCRNMCVGLAVLTVPMLANTQFSITYGYMCVWFIALMGLVLYNGPQRRAFNALYALKQSNGWWVGTPVVRVDTQVSAVRDTLPVSGVWFALPCIVY